MLRDPNQTSRGLHQFLSARRKAAAYRDTAFLELAEHLK